MCTGKVCVCVCSSSERSSFCSGVVAAAKCLNMSTLVDVSTLRRHPEDMTDVDTVQMQIMKLA